MGGASPLTSGRRPGARWCAWHATRAFRPSPADHRAGHTCYVHLELTDEEAAALASVLDQVLRDASSEIAATDNANYRAELNIQRERIGGIRDKLPKI